MTPAPNPRRTPAYKPGLAWFACIGTLWVYVLVSLGAWTTTIGAGMAFPDWPLSNGSLNPAGWLTELDKFAEHSHRLSASLMSAITIFLAIWIWRVESRAWLRRLAVFAVALVLAQALVGGLRVLFDRMHVEMVNTSLGRLFAMLHAVMAQLFVCNLIAIAAACTRWWHSPTHRNVGAESCSARTVPRLGLVCCALIFVQLAIAAVMRHSFAGFAIPFFPMSTAEGNLLPATWNFAVAIHFAHRVMAVVLTIAIAWFVIRIWRDKSASLFMKSGGSFLLSLLGIQILLGALIIKTGRLATVTTGHVLVGALVLSATFLLTWLSHRDAIEGAS